MSKHKGRKSRWTEISPTHHVSACGEIRANPRGKWDAFVRYNKRMESSKGVYFYQVVESCGECKRARDAMMAVEEKAKQLFRAGVFIVADKSIV